MSRGHSALRVGEDDWVAVGVFGLLVDYLVEAVHGMTWHNFVGSRIGEFDCTEPTWEGRVFVAVGFRVDFVLIMKRFVHVLGLADCYHAYKVGTSLILSILLF